MVLTVAMGKGGTAKSTTSHCQPCKDEREKGACIGH